MVEMMVLAMEMMMMIPMKVTMTTISPLREGISPTEFCLLESFSFSLVLHPVAAAEYFSRRTPDLRFPEGL